MWAVKTLNIYILGRDFIRQTDHLALYWLDRMQTKMRGWLSGVYICRVGHSKFSIKEEMKTGMQTVNPGDQVLDKYTVHLKEREM